LENLEESLIIISDKQIEFVNDKYLEMFAKQIGQSNWLSEVAPRKDSSFFQKVMGKLWEKDQNSGC
jgi:hypothetical protein